MNVEWKPADYAGLVLATWNKHEQIAEIIWGRTASHLCNQLSQYSKCACPRCASMTNALTVALMAVLEPQRIASNGIKAEVVHGR